MFSKLWGWLNNKFIKKKRLALYLDEEGIGYCLLKEDNRRLYILSYGFYEVADFNDLEKDLKKIYSSNKLKSKNCQVILSKDQYQYFLLDKPNVKATDFEEVLQTKITDYLEYSPEDAVFDYIELPKNSKTNKKLLYFIATNEPLLLERAHSCVSANFHVKSIEIADNVLKNLLSYGSHKNLLEALLVFSPVSTTFLLVKDGQLCMMRHLDINMRSFFEEKVTNEQRQTFLEQLSFELEASVSYSVTVLQLDPVKHLVLAPNKFFTIQCLESLAQLTKMNVRVLDLSANVHCESIEQLLKEPRALPAFGAVMREEI